MNTKMFLSWARRSALGHIALFEIIGTIPLALALIFAFYTEGVLTSALALLTVIGSALSMACSGLLSYYGFTYPLRKAMEEKADARKAPGE